MLGQRVQRVGESPPLSERARGRLKQGLSATPLNPVTLKSLQGRGVDEGGDTPLSSGSDGVSVPLWRGTSMTASGAFEFGLKRPCHRGVGPYMSVYVQASESICIADSR